MGLDINIKRDGGAVEAVLAGRLDSNTAPELDAALKNNLVGATSLAFDLAEVGYVSSAGLRVLLAAFKTMSSQGTTVLRNVTAPVKEVLDITGLSDILPIE